MAASQGRAGMQALDQRALAIVQGRLGLIPQEAADEIVSHCEFGQIDMARLREQTERIGYPILGVVTQINQLCRDGLGEYVHWGATTQDITDLRRMESQMELLSSVFEYSGEAIVITDQNNNGNITIEGTTAQPASIATDGVYIVRGIMYTGDTRGQAWYMDMMCEARGAMDLKTQSALERGAG